MRVKLALFLSFCFSQAVSAADLQGPKVLTLDNRFVAGLDPHQCQDFMRRLADSLTPLPVSLVGAFLEQIQFERLLGREFKLFNERGGYIDSFVLETTAPVVVPGRFLAKRLSDHSPMFAQLAYDLDENNMPIRWRVRLKYYEDRGFNYEFSLSDDFLGGKVVRANWPQNSFVQLLPLGAP